VDVRDSPALDAAQRGGFTDARAPDASTALEHPGATDPEIALVFTDVVMPEKMTAWNTRDANGRECRAETDMT